jgi:hypothetical protein
VLAGLSRDRQHSVAHQLWPAGRANDLDFQDGLAWRVETDSFAKKTENRLFGQMASPLEEPDRG